VTTNVFFKVLLSHRCRTGNANFFNTLAIKCDGVTTWEQENVLEESVISIHNHPFFIIFLNAISVSADILILSADIFIVFFYAIRRFTPKSICSFL